MVDNTIDMLLKPHTHTPPYSYIVFLNDDYKGGEFLMFDHEEKIELKAGDIMIFPSVFLYPHKVAPVTKGIRDAFVSWVW